MVFSASTVFARVGDEYVRYAAEFLGRINLATLPLLRSWPPEAPTESGWGSRCSDGRSALAVQSWLGWFMK